MKRTVKIQHFILAAFALAASIAAFSCKKEAPQAFAPDAPQVFGKEVVVTDASGKNSVTLAISSADKALLDGTDWAKALRVSPIFEMPSADIAAPEADEAPESPAGLDFAVISRQIEPGALGLSLRFESAALNAADDRSPLVQTFSTSLDNIMVAATNGCHKVVYSWKATSVAPYSICCNYIRCAPSSSQFSAAGSYMVRAKITFYTGGAAHIAIW